MSRELKFRCWNNCLREYIPEEELLENFRECMNEDHLYIEQYIGLKDKKGKEIYEGDIVKLYQYKKLQGIYLVQYDELNGEYVWCLNEDTDSAEYGSFPYLGRYQVIGNIHENPELLGDEDV